MELEKNDIKPTEVVAGSKSSVWWICKRGHEWETKIINRTRGNGCPYCSGYRVDVGRNDLKSTFPDIANEWNYERNEKTPSDYGHGSRAKVWWICKRGHEYQAVISDRTKGNGCPKCREEVKVSFPEKAVFYYLSKTYENVVPSYRADWLGAFELDVFIPDYGIAVEYDGEYGHSTKKGINRDIRKNKVCSDNDIKLIRIREPKCGVLNDYSIDILMGNKNELNNAIELVFIKINDLIGSQNYDLKDLDIDINRDSGEIYSLIEYSERENSLAERAPEITQMWHPTKNGRLTPEYVSVFSSKRIWWQGACGHVWQSSAAYEVSSGKCPFCTGKRVLKGFNDLATTNPELLSEWNYACNLLSPEEVTAGSGKKVSWKCKMGHTWEASIVSRKRGNGCPICANRQLLVGYNDLGTYPDLAADFDSVKNGIKPEKVCVGTQSKYWWKCVNCGNEWKAPVEARVRGRGCPVCSLRKKTSVARKKRLIEKGVLSETNTELMKDWNYRKNTEVSPDNIHSGYPRKVWWICHKCKHEWQATVASRTSGRGCPRCADEKRKKKRRSTLLNKKAPISQTHPSIAAEWDFVKNTELSPNMVTAGSGKRVWWICHNCGFSYDAYICDKTRGKRICPNCNKKIL